MQVNFFRFRKRVNSTMQPDGGTTYNCTIKDGSGAVNPTISLKWDGSGSPATFNYAQIPDFGRYYWISEWRYLDRQWTASLRSDPLATAKTEIGSAFKYILRAASDYDPDVLDSKYPAKMSYKSAQTIINNPYGDNMRGGVYIVSISGQGTSGVQYLQMDESNFQTMISQTYLNSQQIWQNLSSNSVEEAIKNYGLATYMTAANPYQYINSVMWFPKAFSSVPYGNVVLGPIATTAAATRPARPNGQITISFTVPTIPTSEAWEKTNPYRTYQIYLPPFGLVDLDASLCSRVSTINVSIIYDYVSGGATATFYGLNDSDPPYQTIEIAKVSGQIGIPVATASKSVDNLGAITQGNISLAGGLAGGILGLATGNIGGITNAISQSVGAIDNAARANAGYVQQKGTSGGIGYLEQNCWMQVIQYDAPEQSPQEFGRPLMKVKQIADLSGFVLCAEGEISAALTDGELDQIAGFLTGGFFYE